MSQPIHNAALMAMFHRRFGMLPNYEDILEATYRIFVQQGDVVIDIGAHAGRHTEVFSALVGATGRVHAFEPLPYAFDLLKSRGFSNNVELYNYAISPESGYLPFVYAKGAPEESGLRSKTYNFPNQTTPEIIQVAARALDEFSGKIGRVDFIKIDSEGSEVDCLKSGIKTISTHRPLMTVEYGFPSYSAFGLDAQSLFRIAVSMGYVIGDMFGAYCADLATWMKVCDVSYWDWFLVPLERLDEWQAKIRL